MTDDLHTFIRRPSRRLASKSSDMNGIKKEKNQYPSYSVCFSFTGSLTVQASCVPSSSYRPLRSRLRLGLPPKKPQDCNVTWQLSATWNFNLRKKIPNFSIKLAISIEVVTWYFTADAMKPCSMKK